MPARIKRERTRGWRLAEVTTNPLGAVIVDRGSRFGNPFVVEGTLLVHPDGRTWQCGSPVKARQAAVVQHAAWLDGDGPDVYEAGGRRFDRRRVLADLPDLYGRDLACPCDLPEPGQPDHCHAQTLITRANKEQP